MRKVFYYKEGRYAPVEDFITKADEKVKRKFLFCIGYILGEPGALSEPYVKHISLCTGLYEMRLKAYELLMGRKFHPWEGGEGKATTQYTVSLIEQAKKALMRFLTERDAKHIAA